MLKVFLIILFISTMVSAGFELINHSSDVDNRENINRKKLALQLDQLMKKVYDGDEMDVQLKFSKLSEYTIKGFGLFSRMMKLNRSSPSMLKTIVKFKNVILNMLYNTERKEIQKKYYFLIPKDKYDPLMDIVTFFYQSIKNICYTKTINGDKDQSTKKFVFCTDIYSYFRDFFEFLSNFNHAEGRIMIEEVGSSMDQPSSGFMFDVSQLDSEATSDLPISETKTEGKTIEDDSRRIKEKTTENVYKAWVKSAPKFPKSQDTDSSDSSDSDSNFWGKVYFSGLGDFMKGLFRIFENTLGSSLPDDVIEGEAAFEKEVREIIGANEKVLLIRRDPSDKAEYSLIIRKKPMEALIRAFEIFITILNQYPFFKPCEDRLEKAKAALEILLRKFLPNGAFFEEKIDSSHIDFLSSLPSISQGRVAEISNLPFQSESTDRLKFLNLLERVRQVIVGGSSDAIERVKKSQLYNPIRNFYFHLHRLLLIHGGDSHFLFWAIKCDDLLQSLCKTSILNNKTINSKIENESIIWKNPESVSEIFEATGKLMEGFPLLKSDPDFEKLAGEAQFIAQKLKGSHDQADSSTFLIVESDRVEYGSISEPPRSADTAENPIAKASPLLLPDLNQLDSLINYKQPQEYSSSYKSGSEKLGERKEIRSKPSRPARSNSRTVRKVVINGKGPERDRNRNKNDKSSEISLNGEDLPNHGALLPSEKKNKTVRRTVIVLETFSCEFCLNQPNRDFMKFITS